MYANRFTHAALRAARRGWHVFPVRAGTKTPAVTDWENAATTDTAQIQRWWTRRGVRNIGIATGPSRLVVLDLDQHGRHSSLPEKFRGARNGADVLTMLATTAGDTIPPTFEVITPHGRHLYFIAPPGIEVRNSQAKLGWCIDVRARGGYVVAPGSVTTHTSGQLRRARHIDPSFLTGAGDYLIRNATPPALLPAWITEALTAPEHEVSNHNGFSASAPTKPVAVERLDRYRAAILDGEARKVADAQPGTRHKTLLAAARTLGRLVGGDELDEATVRTTLHAASRRHIGIEHYTEAEIIRTIDRALAYGRQCPRYLHRAAPSLTPATGTEHRR
ncbi:bifunctional DNA primase/polymerase [Sciscionella marina]|uniref:bifunctional DNA primase/polymerase n=1 Tax=Sciscionella marina TaxID=508770 RepID=UPI000370A5FB|nr:bifunctional DNA primase/polymerase [Sciscionella marina]